MAPEEPGAVLIGAAWLLCSLCAYLVFRSQVRREYKGRWTRGDRRICLALSLLGGGCSLFVAVLFWIGWWLANLPPEDESAGW